MNRYCIVPSPVGRLLLVSNGRALTWLAIEGQRYSPDVSRFEYDETCSVLQVTRNWLEEYFAGGQPGIDGIPLAPEGTAFRLAVWQLLTEIPYGTTVTYGELARRCAGALKQPCAQAVGGAVGHNPVSIIIPCHRVIGADGTMVGYGGGLAAKRYLLELERMNKIG